MGGKIYRIRGGKTELKNGKTYNHKPKCKYRIIKQHELIILIGIMDNYRLKTKKLADYIIWREFVMLHCKHPWQEVCKQMKTLAKRLSNPKTSRSGLKNAN